MLFRLKKGNTYEAATSNFIKKETLAQVFSWEFCEISMNTFLTQHLCVTTSDTFKEILKLSECKS